MPQLLRNRYKRHNQTLFLEFFHIISLATLCNSARGQVESFPVLTDPILGDSTFTSGENFFPQAKNTKLQVSDEFTSPPMISTKLSNMKQQNLIPDLNNILIPSDNDSDDNPGSLMNSAQQQTPLVTDVYGTDDDHEQDYNVSTIRPSTTDQSFIDPRSKMSKSYNIAQSLDTGNNKYNLNEDALIHLDYSSINDAILNKNTANLVLFYANLASCRHCSMLFNIWSDLANDIRWWKQVIKLFAIDCSEEDNLEPCRRAGANQIPQVKFYWIQSSSLDLDGQRIRILGKSVHGLRHSILDIVVSSYNDHNKMLSQQKSGADGPSNPILSIVGPLISSIMNNKSTYGNKISNPLASLGMPNVISMFSSPDITANQVGIGQLITNLFSSRDARRGLTPVQPIPNNWPDLEPIEVLNTQQLIDTLPLDREKSQNGALLIMETPEFLYNGLEVLLDLGPYSNVIYIARVRDDHSQLSKNLTKRDDARAPSLIMVSPDRESKTIIEGPKYTNDEDLRRIFVKTYERRQIKYPVRRLWFTPIIKAGPNIDKPEDEELAGKLDKIYMNDLTNALRVSLMEQVYRHPDLGDDQHNALVKYLYTIIHYFPFQNDDSLKSRFFKRLHNWLLNQVPPIDINDYKKQLQDIDDYIPAKDWVACKSFTSVSFLPDRSKTGPQDLKAIGKMFSNITRTLQQHNQNLSKLNALLGNSLMIQPLNNLSHTSHHNDRTDKEMTTRLAKSDLSSTNRVNLTSTTAAPSKASPLDSLVKSLIKSSLGSDSSILKMISDKLSPDKGGFERGATGMNKFAREYSCGIWKLAHVMLVNEYLKDSPRKDVKHIVIHNLYQYAVNFYGCPMCGNRVSEIYGEFKLNLDESLRDQSDSIMLLWQIHNRINKRLESETRPNLPAKIQFPNESSCPKCRISKIQQELGSIIDWNEKQVLNYLIHHYRLQNIILHDSSDSNTDTSRSSRMKQHPMSLRLTFLTCLLELLLMTSWMPGNKVIIK